jgi:hypothetical protein
VSDPKSEDADVARAGDVHEVGLEDPDLLGHPALVAGEKGIAGEVVVQGKGGKSTFEFDGRKGGAATRFGARSTSDAEEGESPALGESSELPAKGGYAISFAETVSKKCNAT